MALSVIGAVFGEWVGASEGLGYLMLALNNQLATTELFAAVLVLSVMGIALFFLVGLVERLVIPWHHESQRGPPATAMSPTTVVREGEWART